MSDSNRIGRIRALAACLLLAVSVTACAGSTSTEGSTGSASPTGAPGSIDGERADLTGEAGQGSVDGQASRPSPLIRVTPWSTSTSRPPTHAPCSVFPATNVWNQDVARLPTAANSAAMIRAIGLDAYLHPDFDAVGDGIPYNEVTPDTPRHGVSFDYADESDRGPYPIPAKPKIEAGSDRHLLMIDRTACRLYELYDVSQSGRAWHAGSGAIWDLRSNALRPAGWTSADAAGLPILPGLVLYSEVKSGAIRHALRFTAPDTCGYIYPARHQTARPCAELPPMGLRVRLKASVDISGFGPQARVVLTALKRYGMILADNGSPWYVSGEPSGSWNDDQLHRLQTLHGSDFEVVETRTLRNP